MARVRNVCVAVAIQRIETLQREHICTTLAPSALTLGNGAFADVKFYLKNQRIYLPDYLCYAKSYKRFD